MALSFVGCGSAQRRSPHATDDPRFVASPGLRQQGLASYYANSLAGNRTASGERYVPQKLSAAHKTLPFGTWLRVTRLASDGSPTGPHVEVRVNDRGPFTPRRILDVSMAAARRLGMIGPGVVRVELQVISAPTQPP